MMYGPLQQPIGLLLGGKDKAIEDIYIYIYTYIYIYIYYIYIYIYIYIYT